LRHQFTVGVATLALIKGRVLTQDPRDTTATAVAAAGGRIIAVGHDQDIRALTDSTTQIIDLHGRTVLPGFIDAHNHVELGTHATHFWVDVRGVDREEVLARIRAAAATRRPGDWVVGQGTYGMDMPSRAELDAAAPDHPVVVRWSMHKLVANSAALDRAGISRESAAPAGSRIEFDQSGEPTGFIEEGFDLFRIPWASADALKEALRAYLEDSFLRRGITTVYELPASTGGVRCYQELAREERLPVRLTLNYTISPGHQPLLSLEELVKTGLRTGFGDDWIRLGAVKIFTDGDEAAAFGRTRLADRPAQWGVIPRTFQELARVVTVAMGAGLQVWIHAIGDVAQDMALDALAQAVRAHPGRDHRSRIEHIANEVTDWSQLDRMKSMGVIPVPTAAFMHNDVDDLPEGGRKYIYRTLLERGFLPPGNADTAGTQPFAINPLYGIYCMVARKNKRGELVSPQEAISVSEAIRMYTANSAYAGFEESRKGSIEPGKLADLVVLPKDPAALEPEELLELPVDITIVNGRVAWRRE
jgi:predicted amidohydrolase YtcJ